MSGRMLRKILKEQEQKHKLVGNTVAEKLQETPDDDDESDVDARPLNPFNLLNDAEESNSSCPVNPFDLLNDDDDDGNDQQEDELTATDDPLSKKNHTNGSVIQSHVPKVPATNKKSKKKKKKKNKEESLSYADGLKKSVEDELEALALDIESGQEASSSKNSKACVSVSKQSKSSILKVDPKFLNAEYELRRIFGSKVVSSFENANQASTSRQVRGGKRGGFNHRKCILVSPCNHWPRWDGSLSMEFLESKNGNNYFRYVQSASYSQAQRAFEAAKAIHDLNGVASILTHHPYHVESLMTLADYFKFSGEQQMAADSIAKCLYALECAWHPLFNPLQGDCRLEFTHETNKPLFSTLFNHMKNLDRRGCHRSALEVCKLLLSLDSADPMGATFCIDYFALRAEEYSWLEQFSVEFQSDNSLWNFPNFAYSLAICRYYIERESNCKEGKTVDDKETSSGLMKQALMLHPPVLKRLVAKVPLKDQAWATITKNPFFKSEDSGIPSLDHLIRIYVERSYLIWRLPDVQKLLKDAALEVIETLKHDATEANTWACVRRESFPSQKNGYEHLMVSDFSDAVATMPPENLQNFMIADPRMREMMENQNQGGNVQVRVPRELGNRSALAVLFESLLPWANYGTDEDGNDQPNRHNQDNEHI